MTAPPKRGDIVRLKGKTETATVKGVGPGTVEIGVALDKPLDGYMTWNAAELEVVPKTVEQLTNEFVTVWRRMDHNFSPEDCGRLRMALTVAFATIQSDARRSALLEAAAIVRKRADDYYKSLLSRPGNATILISAAKAIERAAESSEGGK